MTETKLADADSVETRTSAIANRGVGLVRFIDVDKSYDGSTMVVDRLNLSVRRGEFLTLLGPSGSGKTTCLMMLAGFEAPSGGDILLAGRSLSRVPPYARGIGVVFQNYALFPHMTIAENVAYPLRQRKVTRADIDRRVSAALRMIELDGLAARRPAQLSGGQQQRVALARAIVFEPDLVLMDEPLGALDRRLREQMQLEIRRLHATLGNTVVYVTHDQGEALTMSDRVAVFNRGRIEQIATPEEIYEQPATSFVANFIGDNNAIPAVVREANNTACRVELQGGQVLLATAAKMFRVGEAVELSIRPELIDVDVPKASVNSLTADVRDVTYYGDHALLHCASAGDIAINARIGVRHERAIVRGARVHLSWRPEDIRALEPSPRDPDGTDAPPARDTSAPLPH
jgi:putative spermidine/putrescine transport system ATP-binding protein